MTSSTRARVDPSVVGAGDSCTSGIDATGPTNRVEIVEPIDDITGGHPLVWEVVAVVALPIHALVAMTNSCNGLCGILRWPPDACPGYRPSRCCPKRRRRREAQGLMRTKSPGWLVRSGRRSFRSCRTLAGESVIVQPPVSFRPQYSQVTLPVPSWRSPFHSMVGSADRAAEYSSTAGAADAIAASTARVKYCMLVELGVGCCSEWKVDTDPGSRCGVGNDRTQWAGLKSIIRLDETALCCPILRQSNRVIGRQSRPPRALEVEDTIVRPTSP